MIRCKLIIILILLTSIVFSQNTLQEENYKADIIIYGGTSSAIISGIKAASLGRSVIIISPDNHLGGMTSNGLGFTDSGHKEYIGGLAKEFYHRVYQYYSEETTWNWVSRNKFKNKGQDAPSIDDKSQTMWTFEPHVAEQIFDDWLKEYPIQILKNEWLDRERPLDKEAQQIIAFYTLSGKRIEGKIFIDASYEGDLMALTGVSYHVGRESNSVYNETYNGIQKGVFQHDHNFKDLKINAYWEHNSKKSGLLPKISEDTPGNNGDGDHRVEAYCYRLCLTQVRDNFIPITKPDGYNPKNYELLGRIYEAGWDQTFVKFDAIPNGKTDVNNHGPFSHDNIGMNYEYPEASYEKRKEIEKEHQAYQQGLLFFIKTDPRVPDSTRLAMAKWGYAKDEFKDNNGFPHQLYIREARRMIGSYVMTEHDVMGKKKINDPIGMGSYSLDSHNVQRYVTFFHHVENEGDIGVNPPHPYSISMRSILPKENECTNLIVPVCLSSSHIAYGSIRMEPVFMLLGESASQLADLALKNKTTVQKVNYNTLKGVLLEANQILTYQK